MQRFANERDTSKYVELICESGSAEVMREDVNLASEFIFLGLRLEDGIDLKRFAQLFGFDLNDRYAAEIDGMIETGLVEMAVGKLRLTRKGKLFSNEVFSVFV